MKDPQFDAKFEEWADHVEMKKQEENDEKWKLWREGKLGVSAMNGPI